MVNQTHKSNSTDGITAGPQVGNLAERLTLAARALKLGFWEWDLRTNELTWDERMCALYGLQPGDQVAAHPSWQGLSVKLLELVKSGAEVFELEDQLTWPNDEIHYISTSVQVFRGEGGQATRLIGTAYDITHPKLAEQERLAVESSLRKRTHDQEILLEARRELSNTLNPHQIYPLIYKYISDSMHCFMLILSSFDPETELLTCKFFQSSEGVQDVSELPPIPLEPPGQGTQSLVVRSGESLLMGDYEKARQTSNTTYIVDEQANICDEDPSEISDLARSAIIVPLKVEGKVVGVLQVFSNLLNDYTLDDLHFVEALSFVIAASLSNAWLFAELEHRVAERTQEIETIRQRLELATRAAALGVWEWNIKTGRIIWDDQINAILGEVPALSESNLDDLVKHIHPEDLPGLDSFLQKTSQSGQPARVEFRFIRKDGSIAILQVHGQVNPDEQGQPGRVAGVALDITQEKLSEDALRESEERYRETISASGAVPYNLDYKANAFTFIGDDIESITGYTRDELTPDLFYSRIEEAQKHGDLNSQDYAKVRQQTFNTEAGSPPLVLQSDLRILKKDGASRWLSDISVQVLDSAGKATGSIGILQDISERKRAEQILRQSEEQNRLLFEEAPDPVLLLDGRGAIVRANRAFASMVEAQPDLFTGHTTEELGLDNNEIMAKLKLAGPEVADFSLVDYAITSTSGKSYHVESRTFPITLNGAAHYLVTIRDISAHMQAQETLRLANAEMERALRMRDEFLANMSHELRTPLNAILGLSESLESQGPGPLNERQARYINVIYESGQHLLDLINDILDLSKVEAGKIMLERRVVGVHSICEGSMRMMKELAMKKHQAIKFTVEPGIETVWADERRLKQMLVNLLSNAIKFTPDGGSVGLEVAGDQIRRMLVFTVTDTGIGITPEDGVRLFKPFVQLDSGLTRRQTGSGLGLALVAQMAKLHGGNVRLESTPGQGSRFSLSLPWTGNPQPGEAGRQPTVLSRPVLISALVPEKKFSGRILVVEDTDTAVLVVREALESLGYTLTVANDGSEGLRLARELVPDLILMDVQMPVMNGLEATRLIRVEPQLRHIPILGMTALAMPGDRESCLAAGMNDYVSKPITIRDLVLKVQEYLEVKGTG